MDTEDRLLLEVSIRIGYRHNVEFGEVMLLVRIIGKLINLCDNSVSG